MTDFIVRVGACVVIAAVFGEVVFGFLFLWKLAARSFHYWFGGSP